MYPLAIYACMYVYLQTARASPLRPVGGIT